MTETIRWTLNRMPRSEDRYLPVMGEYRVARARAFHRSFPQYAVTPLRKLEGMADYLGVDSFFVKDESYRFGLNAFKVLGGSFAMGRYIAQQLGKAAGLSGGSWIFRSQPAHRSPSHGRDSKPGVRPLHSAAT